MGTHKTIRQIQATGIAKAAVHIIMADVLLTSYF